MKVKVFNIKYNVDDKSLPTEFGPICPINEDINDKYFEENLMEEVGGSIFEYKYVDEPWVDIISYEYKVIED